MQTDTTESSVMVSLRELVALESERVQEEELAREQARRDAEQARLKAQAEQRAAEEARRVAEEARRAEQQRRDAEEAARLAAIEQAEVERARIQASAAAQRQVAEAQQLHERELVRIREQTGSKRLKTTALIGAVVVLLGASAATFGWVRYDEAQQSATAAASARVEAERKQLAAQRLADLDQLRTQLRQEVLRLKDVPAEVAAANAQVQQAHARVTAGELRDADLDAYAQALGTLSGTLPRAHRLDRLARLDEVYERLQKPLAQVRRKSKALTKAAKRAASRRDDVDKSDPSDSSLKTFATALQDLADELPAAAGVASVKIPGPGPGPGVTEPKEVCQQGDPLCGLQNR